MMERHNRRRCARTPCSVDAVIYSLPHPICPGFVYDTSDGGLGMATRQHYNPGTLVCVAVADEQDPVVVKVVRADYQASGGWLVGCVYLDN